MTVLNPEANNGRDIPLVIAAFLVWKSFKGTKFVSLEDIPIREALDEIARHPEPLEVRPKGWKKVVAILWE